MVVEVSITVVERWISVQTLSRRVNARALLYEGTVKGTDVLYL